MQVQYFTSYEHMYIMHVSFFFFFACLKRGSSQKNKLFSVKIINIACMEMILNPEHSFKPNYTNKLQKINVDLFFEHFKIVA